MIVVAIIGILAAVAIPMMGKYIKRSRTPEYMQTLNKLWAGSVVYYNTDRPAGVPKQFPGPGLKETPTDNASDTRECGCLPTQRCSFAGWGNDGIWLGLNFGLPDPHVFRPGYTSTGTGTNAQFTAEATGDLDCDATLSRYTRAGAVTAGTGDISGSVNPTALNDGE